MDSKTQFNAKISKGVAEKVRIDAVKSGRSLGDVTEIILSDFFNSWTWQEREKFYAKKPAKLLGRPTAKKAEIRRRITPALKEIGLEKGS